MAVAADHVATGHQGHSWAMLVADGTRDAGAACGFGALLGAGGGRILGGPFRDQTASAGINPAARAILKLNILKGFDGSILEVQLCQKALQLLLQKAFMNTPPCDVAGRFNLHGAGKPPLSSSSFAFCCEFLLDLIHPKLLESLRLNVIRRSSIHELLRHLLTERHAGERRALTSAVQGNSLFSVPNAPEHAQRSHGQVESNNQSESE